MRNPAHNRNLGIGFEGEFFKRAVRNGFWPIKNYLTAIPTGPSKFQVTKSDLDFKLLKRNPAGPSTIGYFDCKTFEGEFFVYSQINGNQIKRAVQYYEWRVPSGFIVYFRQLNAICLFTGPNLKAKGPGSRFAVNDGLLLGSLEDFTLKPIWAVYNEPFGLTG